MRRIVMGKQFQKFCACTAFLALCGGFTTAAAADSAGEVYEINPVTVTASRYDKRDLDVPASTQVMTQEQLRQTGAVNMQKALAFLDGVVYHQMGPGGAALSSMTSDLSIRGVNDGTLVLVNGTPINWRGLYNLEDIPVSNVERVEVVRGGGAVLYGSQAIGGVVNIITKKKLPNEVSAGIGNKGQQNYSVSANAGKLSVAYNYNKWGDIGFISSTLTPASSSADKEMKQHFRNSEKNDFLLTYQVNDKIDFLYNHDDSWNNWSYTFGKNYGNLDGQARYSRLYDRQKDFAQMNFRDGKGISGRVFYNRNTLDTKGWDYYSSKGAAYSSAQLSRNKEVNTDYGYDVQKVWQGEMQTFLLGTSYDKEKFHKKDYYALTSSDYSRNNFSVFGQWDRALTAQDRLILSGRETWTTGAAGDKNYTNFSGQAQYLHQLNENQTVYASAGRSFAMPSFSNMYSTGSSGNVIGDPNLKPKVGTHYEMGWKLDQGKVQYRAALFIERIKDDITFSKDTQSGQYYAINQDFKNAGVELGVTVSQDNGWAWHYGLTYNDPKAKYNGQKAGTKIYWDRMFGRWIMNGGVSYHKDKWTTAFNASYLADRVLCPSSSHSFDIKPYLITSMSIQYSPDASSDIQLSIDNVLDREDNLNHASGTYYSTPFNYMLSYRYKF